MSRRYEGETFCASNGYSNHLHQETEIGRLDLDLDDVEVVRVLNQLQIWPIDLAVARTSTRLDFKGDPADELIAATSVVHGIPLLTRDRAIRRSKIVPLAVKT